jgi:hypothetical protein
VPVPFLWQDDLFTQKGADSNGHILESLTVTPRTCLHYAMNLPTSVVITGCDSMSVLEQALTVARSFRPLKQEEVEAILAGTAHASRKEPLNL